jgi:hypothetical protein
MVVDHLDLVRVAVAPDETDTPLIVDADAVLASPVFEEPKYLLDRSRVTSVNTWCHTSLAQVLARESSSYEIDARWKMT